MEGYQWGGGEGRMGEKVQGIRSINGLQNRQGEVKNSMGNEEARELICMTHGHELRWGECWRVGDVGQRGIKGRKKFGQ